MDILELKNYNLNESVYINIQQLKAIELIYNTPPSNFIRIYLGNNKEINSKSFIDKNAAIKYYNFTINELKRTDKKRKMGLKFIELNDKMGMITILNTDKLEYFKYNSGKITFYFKNFVLTSKSDHLILPKMPNTKIERLENKIDELENKIDELKEIIEYLPNIGSKYFESKEHFESLQTSKKNE